VLPVGTERDYDLEAQDNEWRKYSYDFDWIIRAALLRRWAPIPRGGAALEVGAYEGAMTAQILEHVDVLHILEPSAQLSAKLEERFGDRVRVTTKRLEDTQFEGAFEVIFLVHTLEHLDDPIQALQRLATWLSPSGRLLVAVPNALALSRQIAVRMGIIDFHAAVTAGEWAHGHRRTYTRDTLRSDILRAGLLIEQSGGVIVKPMTNSQFDSALASGIITPEYVEACDALSDTYPELSASIFAVCVSAPAK
jgi:SAM-dependent methyltransferase